MNSFYFCQFPVYSKRSCCSLYDPFFFTDLKKTILPVLPFPAIFSFSTFFLFCLCIFNFIPQHFTPLVFLSVLSHSLPLSLHSAFPSSDPDLSSALYKSHCKGNTQQSSDHKFVWLLCRTFPLSLQKLCCFIHPDQLCP